MQLLTPPNLLSLFRLMGAPVVFVLLLKGRFTPASILFVLASASDWIDGFLARRFSWQSRLGSYLDPVADKLLVFLTYLALTLNGSLPWWLFWLVVGRDVLILMVGFLALTQEWRISLMPSQLSKFNTAVQLGLIFDMLIALVFPTLKMHLFFPQELVYLTALTTILSALDYSFSLAKQWKGR